MFFLNNFIFIWGDVTPQSSLPIIQNFFEVLNYFLIIYKVLESIINIKQSLQEQKNGIRKNG